MSSLWTEKYRPEKFKDFKGHENIVKRVKAFVEGKNVPHMLFSGPAGLGKTTLAIITVKELFGDGWRNNFLETNASEERGIDVVRNKIKDFARTRAIGTDLPKIIYLDEADALTRDAQNALRRTMEKYSGTARFILACNYSSKIIDPIQSRCSVFRFKPLEKENVKEIIDRISKEEKLKIDKKAIDVLNEIGEGDVRRVTNILQSCASVSKEINEDLIYEVVSVARPKEILEVLKIAVSKNFIKARDLLLDVMLKHGLSGLDVIKQIQKEIWNLDIEDEKKVELVEQCGEIEFRMVEGSDEFVQIEALLSRFVLVGK